MKKQFCIHIAIVFMFFSCINSEVKNVENTVSENILTVGEAKNFLENEILTRVVNDETIALNPGDYRPIWDKCIMSCNDMIANVDVPILAEKHYKMLRSDLKNQGAEVYKVDLKQKVVITKNMNTGKIARYLVTCIPERGCNNNVENEFVSLGAKKQFSGWAIYSLPFMNYPFKIEKYAQGEKTASIILPRKKGEKTLSRNALKNILGCMQISVCRSVNTRSSEDYSDFWEWFESEVWPDANDGDHLTMENDGDNWWLEDQNGHQYEIPEGLVDNNDIDINGSDSPDETWDEDDGTCIDCGFVVWLEIYHKVCGSYLGMVDASSPGNSEFYCSKCKVNVPVRW